MLKLSKTIDKTTKTSIALKHRQCTRLSDFVSKLGYTRECNYNHFLYPNAKDMNTILAFLLSLLTKKKTSSKIGTCTFDNYSKCFS